MTKPERFSELLDRWKKAEDKCGSVPFQTVPKQKEKSSLAKQNENTIKAYRETFNARNFKQKVPTRGMSAYRKPAQLQNVFGVNLREADLCGFVPPVFPKSTQERSLIQSVVKQNFFFDDLCESEIRGFIDAFEPISYPSKSDIITQGQVGDYFYVLAEGRVSFWVDCDQVGTAEKGASFGELALLYACPRAATVKVETNAKLYRVDQTTFRVLLRDQTRRLEKEKIQLLKSIAFLSRISEEDVKRLGGAMSLITFSEGGSLVRKGDAGEAFYIIHQGKVNVTEITVGDTKFKDITLVEGDYFGERALITNEPRAANVVGASKGKAFCIDRSTFEKVLGKFSRLIMKSQDQRLLVRIPFLLFAQRFPFSCLLPNSQEGIDVLQSFQLSSKQFEELASLVTDKTFNTNEHIFDRLHDTKAAIYLLREGSVALSGEKSQIIKPGGFFGEDALLLDARHRNPRGRSLSQTKFTPMYSACATEKCEVGILTLSDCRTIFDTQRLVDTKKLKTMSIKKGVSERDDEEELEIEAAAVPATTLNRVTTKQWLANTSQGMLRGSVKKQVGLKDFDKHSVLGEGQFGQVWLVSAHVPGGIGRKQFALKSQKKQDPTRGDSVKAIKREIDVLGLMDHPYIVNLVHSYEDPDHIYILMGLVHGGELFDVIHSEQEDGTWTSGIPESDAKFYAMVIADTLDYIHRKQYIFRDLKPENILIDKDGYPIICDFGFGKFRCTEVLQICTHSNRDYACVSFH